MDQDKWWNRAIIGSLIVHIFLLAWVAWVDPFAPKPEPIEENLVVELTDIKDLPPVIRAKADSPDMPKPIPSLKPKAPTAPKSLVPAKAVSPEEATASTPVAASDSAAADDSTSAAEDTAAADTIASGEQDLSCGPVIVSRGTAKYSGSLRKAKEVRVKITIGTDGTVTDAYVTASSGIDGVDAAAVKAAYDYTFRPAQDRYGKPIVSGGVISVTVSPR